MNQYTSYGITDAANSIPRLYETEMKHSLRHQVIRNKVVQLQPMGITSNADWWVSQWGENYTEQNGTWVFLKPSGATCILQFNEDGSLKEASVFAPALFNMYKARFGDVEASKLASTTYVFEQKVGSLTSILAGMEFAYSDPENKGLVNTSLLNGQDWNDSPYLGMQHAVIWSFGNRNNGVLSTDLRIEVKSNPAPENYTVIVRPPHTSGELKPIPMMFENVPNNIAHGLNIAEDDSIEEAFIDIETNTVYFNPTLDNANARMEIWPTDVNNKTETDHSPQYDLRTGELLPVQF